MLGEKKTHTAEWTRQTGPVSRQRYILRGPGVQMGEAIKGPRFQWSGSRFLYPQSRKMTPERQGPLTLQSSHPATAGASGTLSMSGEWLTAPAYSPAWPRPPLHWHQHPHPETHHHWHQHHHPETHPMHHHYWLQHPHPETHYMHHHY